MHNIEKNLALVQQKIAQAAAAHQRAADSITLVAASKTQPVSAIEAAYLAGQRDFGESYLQEAEQKMAILHDKAITWHYIGPLQSNKTSRISELFDWVHSIDRLKIAQRLNDHRPPDRPPLNILLQVNVDNEASKSGIDLQQIMPLAEQIASLSRLKLRGLMAIPAQQTDFEQQRIPFRRMQQALQELQRHYPDCDSLSMGMSGDMQAAIAEGATLVRIGTAIFGSRA